MKYHPASAEIIESKMSLRFWLRWCMNELQIIKIELKNWCFPLEKSWLIDAIICWRGLARKYVKNK